MSRVQLGDPCTILVRRRRSRGTRKKRQVEVEGTAERENDGDGDGHDAPAPTMLAKGRIAIDEFAAALFEQLMDGGDKLLLVV